MKSESDDHLDRIKSEIRADADASRRRAPLPERMAHGSPVEAPQRAHDSSIAELARHAGPAFVDHAYRTILGREPDAEGFARQMAALGAGTGKIEIIGDLRYSEEGRRNGVPIAGLRPRYLLAKLGRVPVLGAIVQWLVAFVSLPHLLRHQRATEASLAVRFGETARAMQAVEQRAADVERRAADVEQRADDVEQRVAHIEQRVDEAEQRDADLRSDLVGAVGELSDRLTRAEIAAHELRVYIEGLNANVSELRQLTLTMNHWTVQVRHSIDAIETAEAEQRSRSDEAAGARILASRASDTQRAQRLAAWAEEIATRIPRGAAVIDLGVGSDWLATLAARGFDASAIETNSALHREARERGLAVTLGTASTLLARSADASFDAVTIAATSDEFAVLLAEAQRVLKRGGCLMVADMDSETPQPLTPGSLKLADFGEPKRLDAFGSVALFVTRA